MLGEKEAGDFARLWGGGGSLHLRSSVILCLLLMCLYFESIIRDSRGYLSCFMLPSSLSSVREDAQAN